MAAATLYLVAALLAASASAGAAAAAGSGVADDGDEARYTLPEGFLFGAGVSAVQTEGAWNTSGKKESAADRLLHTPIFKTQGSHDVAADSYHRYAEDVNMAKQLKLKVFRFSISWARLLPDTDSKNPNKEGVAYYHALLDKIIEANMIPMVTLYHFDHPQSLQDEFFGWEDNRMVAKFVEYADFVFNEFGKKVKYWTTLNEPNQYCMYFNMLFVLGGVVKPEQVDIHRCMHHTTLAHMKAYRLYKTKYFTEQQGQVGYTALLVHAQPKTTSVQDVYAADAFNQMHCGKILHPVVFGDYPEIIKKLLPDHPAFTDDEKKDLKDSADFLGLNIYNGIIASYDPNAGANRPQVPIYSQLLEKLPFLDVGNPADLVLFDKITPEVMERSVLWTWQQYGVPIAITENGYSGTDDRKRAVYLSSYMRSLIGAVHDYGVKVIAYCTWSLIDAFEWSGGYSRPFGLVHVDYENGTLNRSLKPHSLKFFTELADKNVIPFVAPTPSSAPTLSRGAALTLVLGVLINVLTIH